MAINKINATKHNAKDNPYLGKNIYLGTGNAYLPSGSPYVNNQYQPHNSAILNQVRWEANKIRYAYLDPAGNSLMKDLNKRKEYWFDTDNSDQINSYADVITRTLTSMWKASQGTVTWKDTGNQFLEDNFQLFYRGSIQPLIEGDWSAMINNAMVNWSETSNLVDNIWKGWAIESGFLDIKFTPKGIDMGKPFSASAGTEGLKKAFVDRVNYNFDTDSKIANFALEMATPTNVALTLMSLGGGAMAKSAAKEAGEKAISKRALKAFGKNYKGDLQKAMMAAKFNFTTADIKALENITKHATNLRLLAGVNKIKGAVDVIDKLGPKIGMMGTVGIPWNVVKATGRASTATVRYLGNEIERIVNADGAPSLIKTFQKTSEIEQFLTEFSQARKIVGEEGWQDKLIAREDILGAMAAKDNKTITKMVKAFQKKTKGDKAIKAFIENHFNETGEYLAFEVAEKQLYSGELTALLRNLDGFVQESSGNLFKTYDEYANFVSMLSSEVFKAEEGVTKTVRGITALNETIKSLEKITHREYVLDLHEEVLEELTKLVGNTQGIFTELTDAAAAANDEYAKQLAEKLPGLPELLESATEVLDQRTKEHASILARFAETTKVLYKFTDYEEAVIKLQKQKELAYRQAKRLGEVFDPTPFDVRIDQLTGFMEGYEFELDTLLDDILELSAQVDAAKHAKEMAQAEVQKLSNEINVIQRVVKRLEIGSKAYNQDPGVLAINPDAVDYGIFNDILDSAYDKLNYGENDLYNTDELFLPIKGLFMSLRETAEESTSPLKKKTLLNMANILEEAHDEILDGFETARLKISFKEYKSIKEVGIEYYTAVENFVNKLEQFKQNNVEAVNLREQMDKLTKRLYGGSPWSHLKKQEEELKKLTKDFNHTAWEERIENTFVKDGRVDAPKVAGFLDEVEHIANSLTKPVTDAMGTDLGDAGTLEDISFETADLVDKLKSKIFEVDQMLANPNVSKNQLASELDSIFDDLTNIERGIKRSVRELNLKGALDVDGSGGTKQIADAVKVQGNLYESLTNILNAIEETRENIALTADLEVKATDEVLNSYALKVNALTRNLIVLGDTPLNEILDAVEMGDYTSYPTLGSLEAITRTDVSGVIALKNNIVSGNMTNVRDDFFKVTGVAWDPKKHTPSSMVESLDNFLEIYKHAETIVDTLEGMVSVRRFYGEVEQAIAEGLDPNVATTFLDAVQRAYDNPATLISALDEANNPGQWRAEMTKLLHNMEMQLRGMTHYNVKAESWRDRIFDLARAGKLPEEALTEYQELFPNNAMTHTAIADAYSEYLVHKYILKNDANAFKYVYMDIEAAGLNLHASTIYQQSVVIPETGIFRWYINTGVTDKGLPSEEGVYKILFPGYETASLDELKEMFKDIYMSGDTSDTTAKKLSQYFGVNVEKIQIVSVNGEKNLLEQAHTFVQSQKPPNSTLKYRLHNGLEYDIPLINNRIKNLGLDTSKIYYTPGRVEDTKIALEEMLKMRKLSVNEKSIIENLMIDHTIRRATELSTASMRRLGQVVGEGLDEIDLSRGPKGKFLPTMDLSFVTAMSQIGEKSESMQADNILQGIGSIDSNILDALQTELGAPLEDVRQILTHLSKLEKDLRNSRLIIDATDITKGQRIVSADIINKAKAEGMEKLLANHVGIDLMSFNTIDGVYIPTFAPKTLTKPNLVAEFFDYGDTKVSENMMKKMTKVSGNIQKTMLYARSPELIDSFDLKALNELHDILRLAIQNHVGQDNFSPVLGNLKKGETNLRAFANVYELFKRYNSILEGAEGIVKIGVPDGVSKPLYTYAYAAELFKNSRYKDIMETLLMPETMFKRSLGEYGDYAKIFQQEPATENLKAVFKFFRDAAEGNIVHLRDLEKAQGDLKYTKVLRTLPIYRGVMDSFDTFEEIVRDVMEDVQRLIDIDPDLPQKHITEDMIYARMRPLVEALNNLPGIQKLEEVINYTPEEMASYLRHQAKGVVVFSNKDLLSSNYFPKRHPLVSQMPDILTKSLEEPYMQMLDKRKAFEELGINIEVKAGLTIIHFKASEIDKIRDIAYTPIKHSYNLDAFLDDIIEQGLRDGASDGVEALLRTNSKEKLKKALKEIISAREHLSKLAPDANTSTLELMDESAMQTVLDHIQRLIPDGLTVADMEHLGMFQGNFFNHSVLGSIDSRRTFMPFTSYNPAKTIYHAVDMVHKRLDTQLQFLEMVQLPEFKLANFIGEGKMSKKEAVDYIKKSKLKIAFLNNKSKDGLDNFRLSSIKINSVKDLDFALKVGATVVDGQAYNTAANVINRDRIQNKVIRFLDRTLVAPFKIGWLTMNYGVAGRNTLDNITKNLQTSQDLGIVSTMAKTIEDYYRYKNTVAEIYEYAKAQRIHIDVAVDEWFVKNPDSKLPRVIFDLFQEYQSAGGEVGMLQGVLDYYGDIVDKIYKQVGGEESGLSALEFRELMQMPDDAAMGFLGSKFGADTLSIRTLMDAKINKDIYQRAYAMKELFQSTALGVTDFVTYLKTGRIDPMYLEVVEELMEKTKDLHVQEDLLAKILKNPVVSNTLAWTKQVEEISRLSLYKILRDRGDTVPQAMSEILKTHFDYSQKNKTQQLLEMIMPFSTFKTLTIQYWAEAMLDTPGTTQVAAKAWNAFSGYHTRDIEDIIMRRGLQYQLFTGNVVIDEESGLTAKINPGIISTLEFFAAPHDVILGSFHPAGRALIDWINAEPYSYESTTDFNERRKRYAWELVPFLGSHINRITKMQSYGYNLPMSLLLSPLFNITWTPAQGGAYASWNKPRLPYKYHGKRYTPYKYWGSRPYRRPYTYYSKYTKRYARNPMWDNRKYDAQYKRMFNQAKYVRASGGYKDWSTYSTFNRTYFSAQFKFKRGSAFPTKNSRSLNTAFSDVWRRTMSKKGNAKYRFLAFPTNKWTLKLKIGILRNLTSYNRWQ